MEQVCIIPVFTSVHCTMSIHLLQQLLRYDSGDFVDWFDNDICNITA